MDRGRRRWAELANFGMIPLVHAKNTNYSVFMEAPSAQKPKAVIEAVRF